jgi:hypothetical protein
VEEIDSLEELERWLKNRPSTWAAAIALRLAERVFPLALDPTFSRSSLQLQSLQLQVCRAAVIAAIASGYNPRNATAAADADLTLFDLLAIKDGTRKTFAAIRCFRHAVSAADNNQANASIRSSAECAIGAARSATEAAGSYANTIWEMVSRDCSYLTSYRSQSAAGSRRTLNSIALWGEGNDGPFANEWLGLRETMAQNGFGLWVDWYDRRLRGSASRFSLPSELDDRLGHRLIEQDNRWWRGDPKFVNASIQAWIDELTSSSGQPQPQSDFGLILKRNEGGAIEADELAGADQVLTTQEALDRHAEVCRMLGKADKLSNGHNVATVLADPILEVLEVIGDSPTSMRLGRIFPRMELLLRQSEGVIADIKAGDDFSDLQSRARDIVSVLEVLSKAWWQMVNFDPALARRVPLQSDPDKPSYPDVSPTQIIMVINQSTISGDLTVNTGKWIKELAPDPNTGKHTDTRSERRWWETVWNWGRSVVTWVYENKVKTITLTGMMGTGKWMLDHSDWLRSLFANNPQMLSIIGDLLAWLRTLPLA